MPPDNNTGEFGFGFGRFGVRVPTPGGVPFEAAVTDLPTGTLTLLFTDIQGSTRLAQELGDRWPAVLADHKRLLREVFARHDGIEVDNQGDAFFFVFSRAGAAASAAADAQRTLLAHPWPNGRPVRVRMGLHTGEPVLIENAYMGVDVHKAARICSAAHGGQVLLSAASRQLLGGPTRYLGEFRLKDLTAWRIRDGGAAMGRRRPDLPRPRNRALPPPAHTACRVRANGPQANRR